LIISPVGTSITWTTSLSGWAKLTQTWRPSGLAIAKTGWLWTERRSI